MFIGIFFKNVNIKVKLSTDLCKSFVFEYPGPYLECLLYKFFRRVKINLFLD